MTPKPLKSKFKLNAVKIIVIAVVIMFILIVAGGVMKFYQFRSSFVGINASQSETAKAIVLQDMESRGKNVSNYELWVVPAMHIVKDKEASKLITQVQVMVKEKNTSKEGELKANPIEEKPNCNKENKPCPFGFKRKQNEEFYLVDLISNKILMHSETQYYEAPPKKEENPRWFHWGLFK